MEERRTVLLNSSPTGVNQCGDGSSRHPVRKMPLLIDFDQNSTKIESQKRNSPEKQCL
jgi:hypothetical protein